MDGVMVGAITAYIPPQQKETLFVWQVAVAKSQRGQGLAKKMLSYLYEHCMKNHPLRWLETTISPSNIASQKLFTSFSTQHQRSCAVLPYFLAKDFGDDDHEDENLYRIGPWDA
jgi:L-2,4-diaminobutyric acid acetyltransferase